VGGSRNPARQVFALLRNMQQGLEPSVRSGLFAVFNRHLLPVLAQLALMQHNTASSINERLRTWRVRNPFNRLRRDRQDKESSQAHHASSLRPSRQVSKLLEAGRAKDQQLEPVAAAGLYQQAASLCTTSSEVQTRASLLSLASKSLSDATYAPGTSSSQAVQLNQAAIELASQVCGETQAFNNSSDACVTPFNASNCRLVSVGTGTSARVSSSTSGTLCQPWEIGYVQ
jgi:hypothetical protein